MVLGFFLFRALQGWDVPRARGFAELALLLPNMVPPLFLVLALLSWVTPWSAFPYGLGAVVVAHVLMNSGLVAVSFDRMAHGKLRGLSESAWIMGSGRGAFWRDVAWPYLRADVACVFLFVFSLCFTSFSIPLALGGRSNATLEIAIFDAIRMEGRWDKAVVMAVCQSLMLFGLAFTLPHAFWPARPGRRAIGFLRLSGSRLLVFLPAAILILGWLFGGVAGLSSELLGPSFAELFDAMLTTVSIALGVALLHLVMLLIAAYVQPHFGLSRFLNGYLSPSPAITGFALLLLPGESETFALIKLIVALTLISFPLLYRWQGHMAVASLSKQTAVARTLGATWGAILTEIVWPQAAPQFLRVCGLAAFWACGDFALSGILAGPVNTLPLMMQDLMDNYQVEAAQALMFPLLILGLALYGVFTGVARYVAR